METMGEALQHQWANERAERLFRDALAIRERLEGPDRPATIRLLVLLSNVLDRMGRLDESTTVAREAFERARRALGEEHFQTLRSKQRLALCLGGQGRFEEALERYTPPDR